MMDYLDHMDTTTPAIEIELHGHLIDSLTLKKVMDIIHNQGAFHTLTDIRIGAQKQDVSCARMVVQARDEQTLCAVIDQIRPHGAKVIGPCEPEKMPFPAGSAVDSTDTPTILMCPPDYFTVSYAINPWMAVDVPSDKDLARRQWDALAAAISDQAGAKVSILDPAPDLPDLVFTANAAFVYQDTAIIARYKHPERQPEEPLAQAWFEANGYRTVTLPESIYFEGAGDALMSHGLVFAGYKTRTDIQSHNHITLETGLPVLSMELVNPKFYHIDVCFCPLTNGHVMYYPEAFDDYGRAVIEANIPPDKRIPVTDDEAARFACNAVSIGDHVLFNQGSPRLEGELRAKGYNPIPLDLSEFIKAGGSAKCLTLGIR